MIIKKYLALTTAIMISTIMFTSCGEKANNSEDNKDKEDNKTSVTSSEEDTETAGNILMDEINKVSEMKSGKASIKISYDSSKGNEKMEWSKFQKLTSTDITETGYDFDIQVDAAWKDAKFEYSISMFGSPLFDLTFDGENYYADFEKTKDVVKQMGYGDKLDIELSGSAKVSDLFTKLKITDVDLVTLKAYAIESTSTPGIEEKSIQNTIKKIFTDDVINEMKKLSEKAEANGSTLEIKNLTKEDIQPLADALTKSYKDATWNNGKNYDQGYEENENNLIKTNYTLNYDKNSVNQVHNLTNEYQNGDKMTVTVNIEESNDDIDLSKYNSAKTMKEIASMNFGDLINALIGGVW